MGEMIPRNCSIRHNPPEKYADCVRACVATIINRDDVPHTFDGRTPELAWAGLREYLKGIGRFLFCINVEENPREWMKVNNPDIPYILMCSSAGSDHAVVGLNDQIFHDPSWYRYAITGPTSQGFYIILIIGVLP